MLLVPRQLQRVGMTGDVPYYGGRFTPAQAYAITHPRPVAPAVAPALAPPPPPPPVDGSPATLQALAHLRDVGVLTPEEYDRYLARTGA